MLLEKNLPTAKIKWEALRYQPSFDLRKNIAGILAHYSMEAIRKEITLDINIDHEVPNYFHGSAGCFLEIFSLLLKVSIATLEEGEICIRICNNSLHRTNNCETELSITISTRSYNKSLLHVTPAEENPNTGKNRIAKIPPGNSTTIQRIKHLCAYLAGRLNLEKPGRHTTIFRVDLTLHQAFPASRLHLV